MSRTVFILGAGASADAGAPLMKDFIDRAEELLRNKNCGGKEEIFEDVFRAIAQLRGVYAKAQLNTVNIEDVFSAFEMGRILGKMGNLNLKDLNRIYGEMRIFISTTLERAMRFKTNKENGSLISSDTYGNFTYLIDKLEDGGKDPNKPKRSSIITFNYDLALEISMMQKKLDLHYFLDGEKTCIGFPLLKLHGSINWGKCRNPKCNKFAASSTWNLGRLENDRQNVFATPGNASHCGQMTYPEAEVIPPTWNKMKPSKSIIYVWSRAAKELSEAEEIIVIGYSLPDTDLFFRYLFALGTDSSTRIKKFIICNIDKNVEEKFRRLIGKGIEERFTFLPYTAVECIRRLAGLDSKSNEPNYSLVKKQN